MQRSETRILATHTGSLPRPPGLVDLLIKKANHEPLDEPALAAAGQAAVEEAVARQAAAGLDVVNDGEQSRTAFFLYVTERLSGFGGTWSRPNPPGMSRYPEWQKMMREQAGRQRTTQVRERTPALTGPVAYLGDGPIRAETAGFRRALDASPHKFADAFMTAASPGIVAMAMHDEHYGSTDAYLKALGEALRPEYEAIVKAGFVLQIDSPDLALERHTTFAERPLGEFVAFVEKVVATINDMLRNIPRDRVRLHICWGNGEAPHDNNVALSDILPAVLKAKVGALVLPFATGRQAHEYRTFEKIRLPDDMLLVAGVIDTRTNVIEHPEAVADRIERVAAVIGDPSRVLAGTDCGFGTSAGSSRVASDVAWAKLAALGEGARIASARLFG